MSPRTSSLPSVSALAPCDRRQFTIAGLTMAAAPLLAFARVDEASAHHGWNSFDTRRAYFAAGHVTHVRWGNPHGEIQIRVVRTAMPANWRRRELPPGANERDGRETMASARSYRGEHQELHLVTTGPEWMIGWG